jgi:hypothetical protein
MLNDRALQVLSSKGLLIETISAQTNLRLCARTRKPAGCNMITETRSLSV